MANQMIALQARNPQLPDPSRAAAQYANMMNMASQQRATQLQAERTRQEMDYARASEGRAAQTQTANMRKADLDYQIEDMKRLRNIGATVLRSGNEDAYQDLLGMITESDPQFGNLIRRVAPTLNRDVLQTVIMEADKFIEATVPKATYSNEIAAGGGFDAQGRPIPEGTLIQVTNSLMPSTMPIPAASAAAAPARTPAATPAAAAAGTPMRTGKFGETLVVPDSARPLTADQQDHIRRLQEELGMTNTPASFTRGGMTAPTVGQMSPDMVPAILDSAINTGVMAQIDLDQIIAMSPPQARQGIMDVIRSNRIALQADAPSLAASAMPQQQPMAPNPVGRQQSQFAVMRGQATPAAFADLGGQPEMQNTMAQYQPVLRRDPNVSPLPGSSQVPLPRLGAEKRVEAQAAKDVELKMAPQIAAANKKAENAIELKSTAKKAKFDTEAVIDEVADRINTIDQLLRNPNRFSIIGPIEGNLPRLLQTGARADAQAAFDKIKNTATLTSLIDMRRSTETGASPVGANPTDRDAKIVEQAASKLIQTGEPTAFDAELMDMRRKLYRTYVNAQREYDGVYGDVLKENPNLRLAVPKVSDRYLSTKDLPKQKTPVKTPTSTLSPQTRKKYGL
jgi:hypothetical protein